MPVVACQNCHGNGKVTACGGSGKVNTKLI